MLLSPEYEGRTKNYEFAGRKHDTVNHLKNHISQILCCTKRYKDTYSLILNFDGFNSRNVNIAKLTNYLGRFFNSCNELNLALSRYILKKTICIDIEWCLYRNEQSIHLYNCLHLTKEHHFFFFLHCYSFSERAIKGIGKFLCALKINLKSIKCKLHKYIKDIIHLCGVDYLLQNDTNYLFRCSKTTIKSLILKVKQQLYHKNYQGYWRASRYNISCQLVRRIEKVLYLWFTCYSCVLTELEIFKINKAVDYAFYKWQMQQS